MPKEKHSTKEYWQNNIEAFSGFYESQSTEEFSASWPVRVFYKVFVLPLEKKYMRVRYNLVVKYIEENIMPGTIVADVGCGNGIFTRMLAAKAKKVYAIDYTQQALDLTVKSLSPDQMKRVELLNIDITQRAIPKVDVAIVIGVLPYISNPEVFFKNVLPFTGSCLFNFLNTQNPANRLRKVLRFLNVRHYTYNKLDDVEDILGKYGFHLNRVHKLATGFLVDVKKD